MRPVVRQRWRWRWRDRVKSNKIASSYMSTYLMRYAHFIFIINIFAPLCYVGARHGHYSGKDGDANSGVSDDYASGTDEYVRSRVETRACPRESLLATVKRRKLTWFGHVTRPGILHLYMQNYHAGHCLDGVRRRGRHRKSRNR